MTNPSNRRLFLPAAVNGVADEPAPHPRPGPRAVPPARPQPATRRLAIVTSVFRYLSHSYHIGLRFLHGYLREARMHYPDWSIASMYVDQPRDPGDLSRDFAREYGFRVHNTIAGALTLGGNRLAVDGVLLLCEHGDYPRNDRWQIQYPRYEMFQQIVEVFRRSERVVPIFNDKHLSYDRAKAREMVETARRMNIPLMAGSSLPVTWRRPEVELPIGVRIQEALVASAGDLDIYGFHALEALQCMVERRGRGQQGVRSIQTLVGDEVWAAGDAGQWSWDLLEHALGRSPTRNAGDIRRNCRYYHTGIAARQQPTEGLLKRNPAAFLIEYRDGLRATVLLLNGHVADVTFAARIAGQPQPVSTLFNLPDPPGAGFLEALTTKIESFLAGQVPYPIERTLLTSGMLEVALDARVRGLRLQTPDLDVSYDPPADSGFLRGDYVSPTT